LAAIRRHANALLKYFVIMAIVEKAAPSQHIAIFPLTPLPAKRKPKTHAPTRSPTPIPPN
jgi:hypothetical protein